ncbi:MAG TPA: hypothetical protein VMT34_01210, partial [Aggregatilineales bacterium]|nr:hypothetical protein [Aggregatilineales bacterium]
MNRYHLRLFPDQPLALEDIRTIPAAVLRGAIASVAASGCVPGHSHDTGPCQADCRYWSLFGAEAPWRVGAAYAGTDDESGPFPATARTCAVFPGFTSHGGHGVFDVAIRAWLFEGSTPDRLFAPPYSGRCPVCRALLRPPDGLLIRHAEDDFTSTGEIAATIRTTHTTLSRARRRIIGTHTAEGKLVGRGIYFSARLEVAEALDGLLRNTIRAGLWIGARRSRGMGAVRVELAEIAEEEPSLNDR